ncbi:MAG TPA: alpha/beta fold hydrolase, partial [Candidatus Polarisedimenticolia bacterium]|nr:alpha/beta fold hydrolase [Candidatus Polarisedimenticolia bacterium]
MSRLGLTLACLVAGVVTPVRADLPPLIPRTALLGNPQRLSPAVAPDGRRLAYIAPSEAGVLNVWTSSLSGTEAKMVTNDTTRGIFFFAWAEDGDHILYLQDQGGDENNHVYSADLKTGVVRDLTPFAGIGAHDLMTDRDHPGEILVGLNLRDRKVFDMHRIDLATGAVRLDTTNPGDVIGWLADSSFAIRGAVAVSPVDASTILRVRAGADAAWRDTFTWPMEESETAVVVGFSGDGKEVYLESSKGSDATRLVRIDASNGQEKGLLAAVPDNDIWNLLGGASLLRQAVTVVHPRTKAVQAVAFNYLKPTWKVLDESIRKDFEILEGMKKGVFQIVSRDGADAKWIVLFYSDEDPGTYYFFDRAAGRASLLFSIQPELAGLTLAHQEPRVIEARDGMKIPIYVTLPPGIEPRRLPMVLLAHGGPWYRDEWGFDPTVQMLANRGYAVIQVNFRGSTGLGKRHLNAGTGQWGVGSMQHDLSDAVAWAIREGIADPKRVGIMGGSYGGYATLAGLAFTPELYACGVDIVGPSNVKTLFESFPPYWGPRKRRWILRVGDV